MGDAADIVSSPASGAGAGEDWPVTPFWDRDPAAGYVQFDERLVSDWERVQLAGEWLPGVCAVNSPGRIRNVKTYSAPGMEGEAIVDLGATAAHVQIVVTMWTPKHLAQWERFVQAYQVAVEQVREDKTAGTGTAPALDVVHPGLNLHGIHSMYVYQVGVPMPGAVWGTREATILASEFRVIKRPKNNTVNPAANSLSGIDSMTLEEQLQKGVSKKPSATEAGP